MKIINLLERITNEFRALAQLELAFVAHANSRELGHYYQSQQSAVRLAALDAHANSLAELRHAAP